MKTLNIKFIDRITLVFLYSIFFMITCLIINAISYIPLFEYFYYDLSVHYVIITIFFVLLVIRFIIPSFEKLIKFEYKIITILTSIITTITIVIIIVSIILSLVVTSSSELLSDSNNIYIFIVKFSFIIIIPVILIMLRKACNIKYLLMIHIGAVCIYTATTIFYMIQDYLRSNIFYVLLYYMFMIIPLILLCVLSYVNYKFTFDKDNISNVNLTQRLIGIIGFCLVVIIFFSFGVIMSELSFIGIGVVAAMLIFFPAVVVPYYVYYLVIQILYGKYRKEQEKITVKQL